MKMLNYRKD